MGTNAKVRIVGSTFLNNTGVATQEQLYIGGGGAVTLENTVVWGSSSRPMLLQDSGGTLTANHSLVKGQTLSGTGNLAGTVDPKLRADARIRSDSPLRAAGGTTPHSRVDIDGELRPATAPDIGVDQFNDADTDGLADAWEMATAGNTTTIAGGADADGDGLSNAAEYDWETHWLDPDTDKDGVGDGLELTLGLIPSVSDADDLASDLNHDGIGAQLGHQPNQLDDDSDGISNADEILMCTNPLRGDTDGDGVSDSSDAFPLDPLVSVLPSDPMDVTAPTITLTTPWYAVAQ